MGPASGSSVREATDATDGGAAGLRAGGSGAEGTAGAAGLGATAALAGALLAWPLLADGDVHAGEVSGPVDEEVVVVGEGETLWTLALPHRPDGVDAHRWVAEVAERNDVEPGRLRPGEVVRIPLPDEGT